MKTKNLFGKIAPLMMMVALFVFILLSCKKKDDTPEPAPTPTPAPVNFPTSIDVSLPKIMTTTEINKNHKLPTFLLSQAGKGLTEEEGFDFDFGKIGDVLHEIKDYQHTEMEFNRIDNQLNTISTQLTNVKYEMDSIATELRLGIADIEKWIQQQAIYEHMVNIYTLYADSTSQYSLTYYPSMAARIQRGDPTAIPIATLQQYAANYINLNNNALVTNNINSLAGQVLYQNALMVFTKTIILSNGQSTLANQPGNIMEAYKLLENYFAQIINYQLQGMSIVANIDNAIDTTGKTWQNALMGGQGFKMMIQNEVKCFLQTVNYLAVNLYDYRNNNQYANDVQYWQLGLAPDDNFTDVNARAQFVCNVLLDGFGLPYNSVGGTIVIPNLYGSTYSTPVNSLAVAYGGFATQTVSAQVIPSQYLNSYLTSLNHINYDNKWSIFAFSQTDTVVTPGTNNFVVQSTGNTPWAHLASVIQGSFPVKYYNPQTGASSNSKDALHTMPFGHFSCVWWWGMQYYYYSNPSELKNYLIFQYPCGGSQCWRSADCPTLGTTDATDHYYPHSDFTKNFNMSFPTRGYGGNGCKTDHFCYMTDAWYYEIVVASWNGGAEAFVYYNIEDPGWNGTNGQFQSWAGTDLMPGDGSLTNGDLFSFTDNSWTTHDGAASRAMASGVTHKINFGYTFKIGGNQSDWGFGWQCTYIPSIIFSGKMPLP